MERPVTLKGTLLRQVLHLLLLALSCLPPLEQLVLYFFYGLLVRHRFILVSIWMLELLLLDQLSNAGCRHACLRAASHFICIGLQKVLLRGLLA